MFAFFTLVSMPFVFWYLPETYPKTLEEIEMSFNENNEDHEDDTAVVQH